MALIQCPHCKKEISDSCKICVHCGQAIHSERPKTKLSSWQRVDLEREFDKAYPKYVPSESEGKTNMRLYRSSLAALYSAIALLVLGRVLLLVFHLELSKTGEELVGAASILLLVLVILGLIGRIICIFVMREFRKKNIFRMKLFYRWLNEKKGIDVPAELDVGAKNWEREYFKNLDVSQVKI